MTSCAGTNTIAALLAGAADPAAAQQLEEHLDRCPVCRRLVADLGRGLSALGDGTPVVATQTLPQPGETIGRYEIHSVLGVGGMGVVYEARDTTLGRCVAVKLLRPDLLDGPSLLAEAQAMARLQHPNIAVVHDAGIAAGQLYVCMEYVAGSTLRAWVAERPRDWREVVDVYVAAGEGLAYVHRAGLVHLDFKPDNVLVDRDGRVRVTDFGLARIVGTRPAHAGRMIVGTPAYMAPEQRSGEAVDARADQFAFCASLREALGDRHTPRWLSRVIDRGLAAHPSDRFPTLGELLAAIAAGRSRRRGRAASVAAVAVVTLAALVWSFAPSTPRVIDRIVERPVRSTFMAERDNAAPATPAAPAAPTVIVAPSATVDRAVATPPLAARGFVPTRRQPALHLESLAMHAPGALTQLETSDDTASRTANGASEIGMCDDGSSITCALWPPACPPQTVLAVQQGCWTCADEPSCASLGFPRTCNDGTPLRCAQEPPLCDGRRIAAVRNGCWSCQDPFTCWSRSQPKYAPPRKPPPPSPPPPPGPGSNDGSGGPVCGNGMCEAGETHAACASDCCETSGSGACVARCGNGFCETGEDHASCAADCCETSSNGSCLPVCGNGFCETGESAASCPSECQ